MFNDESKRWSGRPNRAESPHNSSCLNHTESRRLAATGLSFPPPMASLLNVDDPPGTPSSTHRGAQTEPYLLTVTGDHRPHCRCSTVTSILDGLVACVT